MDQSGVLLWVKAEPFIVGALQEAPPSKLSLHYLKKVAAYVRTRATERAYPRLYWPTWRHIACGKLQLPKDLAWLYFEIFDNLSERTPEERLEWSEILSNCTTEDEVEKQRNQVWTDVYAAPLRRNPFLVLYPQYSLRRWAVGGCDSTVPFEF